jgi:hypothetical protein
MAPLTVALQTRFESKSRNSGMFPGSQKTWYLLSTKTTESTTTSPSKTPHQNAHFSPPLKPRQKKPASAGAKKSQKQ